MRACIAQFSLYNRTIVLTDKLAIVTSILFRLNMSTNFSLSRTKETTKINANNILLL